MTDENQNPAPQEAGDEGVAEATESEATENTEGQAETLPASEGEATAESTEDKPQKTSRHQRRKAEMARLREERDAAIAEKERAEKRLRDASEASESMQPPKMEDFADHDDYLAAKSAYASMTALDDRERRRAEAELQEHDAALEDIGKREQAQMEADFEAQAAEARTRYADFDAVAKGPHPVTPAMARMITSSEVGADVAYHLGSNPEEAARISKMSDLNMARAMGAIEARLSMDQVTPKTTQAPNPVTPVKPKASAAGKDPAKMSNAEYREWRKKSA